MMLLMMTIWIMFITTLVMTVETMTTYVELCGWLFLVAVCLGRTNVHTAPDHIHIFLALDSCTPSSEPVELSVERQPAFGGLNVCVCVCVFVFVFVCVGGGGERRSSGVVSTLSRTPESEQR